MLPKETMTTKGGKPTADRLWFTLNTLRPKQNGHDFADDIFKCILLIENMWVSIKISPKFVPKGLIDNIQALI